MQHSPSPATQFTLALLYFDQVCENHHVTTMYDHFILCGFFFYFSSFLPSLLCPPPLPLPCPSLASPLPLPCLSLTFPSPLFSPQNNPLLSFLRFHEEFVLRSNFDECRKHLQEFELSMDKVCHYPHPWSLFPLHFISTCILPSSPLLLLFPPPLPQCSMYNYMGTIGDTCWVELLASTMASHMLVMCPTPFERSHLLKLLSEASFGESFQCTGMVTT